jgi:hypothetical protein
MFITTPAGCDFRVISLPEKNIEGIEGYTGTDTAATVLLAPSLTADFSLECYSSDGKPYEEVCLPCIAGCDFLVRGRGLPLDTVDFETPRGRVTVERDKDGFYKVKLFKCKQVYTKTQEISGCKITVADVLFNIRARVIYCDSIDLFDRNISRKLLLAGDSVPSLVVALSTSGGVITLDTYGEHKSDNVNNILPAIAGIYALPYLTGRYREEYTVSSIPGLIAGANFSDRYIKVRACP